MSGKKGIKHYSDALKTAVIEEYLRGTPINELSRKYGVSRYAVQSWCGLRSEVNIRHQTPLPKGRSPKNTPTTDKELYA